MSLRIVLLSIFACATSALCTSTSLTTEGAVSYALKHNPSLAAARFTIAEARGRLQQSGRLSNPDLELEFNKNARSRESSASLVFMQRFPLTGRLRFEKAISRAQLTAAEFEVKDSERKLAAEIRTLAVKIIALQEQQNLRKAQLETLQELSTFLHQSAASGEGSSTDALQAELESRQIEIEKLQLTAEATTLLGEFRALLGSSSNELPTVTGTLSAPSPSAHTSTEGPNRRPDILAAQARFEAAQLAVQEQQARRLEDIGAGVSYSTERTIDDPNSLQTDRTIGVHFSLPLPLWNHNSGRINEAAATAARAAKDLEAARLNAATEALSAKNAMDAFTRILSELDSKALPQAAQIEEQLHASYSTGQTPLVEVLRARSRKLEFQRQRLDALRDYHLASIRLRSPDHQQTASK